MTSSPKPWPVLQPDDWQTLSTLQLWTQMVGKLRVELSPIQNHYWHSALYVSVRGLTSSPIPYGTGLFEAEFDFLNHQLEIETSWGASAQVTLEPRTVADFYAALMQALRSLDINVKLWTTPVEVADPIPFERDTLHASYDPPTATRFWQALVQVDRVFKEFRGRFLGKSSPVHFFWGSFDLAVTRFSGRRAPMWDGPVLNVHPHVMHESYSHEVSSAGLWLGAPNAPAAFYSYAVPAPDGFSQASVAPTEAKFDAQMGEFLLPYDVVRTAERPHDLLMSFLETTYVAAADLGGWDRPLLEQRPECICDLSGSRPRRRHVH
jgi:hypothetical protein